jgi:hypothetical protein
MRFLFLGLELFAIVFLGIFSYGVFLMAASTGLDTAHLVALPGFYFCGGMMVLFSVLYRAPAARLVVDGNGIHLIYRSGQPYSQDWSDPNIIIRGRWTPGVRDIISRGRPLYSIYGRYGGFTETFIPEVAFRDVKTRSESRGLILAERTGHREWKLFTISPPNSR